MSEVDLKEVVKEEYGAAARRVAGTGAADACCEAGETASSSCCSTGSWRAADPITRDLYDSIQMAELPEAAVVASLGYGNPTALAELKACEIVLDLGSGAALTCCHPRSGSVPRSRRTGST